jgi:DNA-binding transcriptional MerR regulator
VSAVLLDLPELAVRSGVPTERLRHDAETGLLPPARRDGDRLGYPPAEASTARMLAGGENLGLGTETLTGLSAAWRGEDCRAAQRRLADAVTARLSRVRGDIGARQRRMADSGPGTGEWAEVTKASVSLFEDASRTTRTAA